MKKTVFLISMITIVNSFIHAQADLSGSKFDFVGEIKTGSGPNELIYERLSDGPQHAKPELFFFSQKGEIAILNANVAILLRDRNNLKPIDSIVVSAPENPWFNPYLVEQYNDRLLWISGEGKFEMDANWKITNTIENSKFRGKYYVDKKLWRFDELGRVVAVDTSGREYKMSMVIDSIKALNPLLYSAGQYTFKIDSALKSMIESGKYLIVDGKIWPKDFKQAEEFYRLFQGSKWRNPSKDLGQKYGVPGSGATSEVAWGRSDDGDLIWNAGEDSYYLISPYGDVEAYFTTDTIDPLKLGKYVGSPEQIAGPHFSMRVSPWGDVYFMVPTPKVIKFFVVRKETP